jgi:hypothetical protein
LCRLGKRRVDGKTNDESAGSDYQSNKSVHFRSPSVGER